MTYAQKLDNVVRLVSKIIVNSSETTFDEPRMRRVVYAWLYVQHLDLGGKSPMDIIDTDYPRLMAYLNYLYGKSLEFDQLPNK